MFKVDGFIRDGKVGRRSLSDVTGLVVNYSPRVRNDHARKVVMLPTALSVRRGTRGDLPSTRPGWMCLN